jgi:hypothetical protein
MRKEYFKSGAFEEILAPFDQRDMSGVGIVITLVFISGFAAF